MKRPVERKNNEWIEENKFWELLKLEKYFRDMRDSDELFDALYVEYTGQDGPSAEYEPVINIAYPMVLKTEGIHTPDGVVKIRIPSSKLIGDHDCLYLAEFIQQALHLTDERRIRYKRSSERLLVVLGGIGEGKTTLLDFFFRRFAKRVQELRNIVRLNINFEEMASIKPSELNGKYIAELLLETIDANNDLKELRRDKDKLLAVLSEPLSLQKGLLEAMEERAGVDVRKEREAIFIEEYTTNPLVLIASIINYLVQNEHKKVVVTLDNVDRLPTVDCQSRAIAVIRLALRQWDCCAIVCVREYTYGNRWLMSECGFERPLLYHKRPPRFAPILQKRFEKIPVEKYTEFPSFEVRGKVVEIKNIKRFIRNIAKFLWGKSMERSLFRLSNGNIRQMLNMVKAFLSFHALDMEPLFLATFLKTREETEKIRRLTVNFDNFIRAITVGNYRYYSSRNPLASEAQETFVLNMIGGPRNAPLLPYRVLTYLRKFEIVNKKPLIRKACCLGVTEQDVQDVLEAFLKGYLIESMQGINIQDINEVVITRKGVCYFDELVVLSMYIENVMNDAWWDREIAPSEQSYNLRERAEFLEESLKCIIGTEIKEAEKVHRNSWAIYAEFLDDRPYCERLCESIVAHLKALKSRGTKLPERVLDNFEKLLDEIYDAKENGRLLYSGSPAM